MPTLKSLEYKCSMQSQQHVGTLLVYMYSMHTPSFFRVGVADPTYCTCTQRFFRVALHTAHVHKGFLEWPYILHMYTKVF